MKMSHYQNFKSMFTLRSRHLLAFILTFTILSLFQPLQKGLASFPDPLRSILVDVLLTSMRTPLSNDLLFEDVGLVEFHKDLRNGGYEVGVGETDEALDTA